MINWIVGGIIAVAVILAVRYIWKQHKLGQCAGGCAGCQGCSHSSNERIKKIKEN